MSEWVVILNHRSGLYFISEQQDMAGPVRSWRPVLEDTLNEADMHQQKRDADRLGRLTESYYTGNVHVVPRSLVGRIQQKVISE